MTEFIRINEHAEMHLDYNNCTACQDCTTICCDDALFIDSWRIRFNPSKCTLCESCMGICEENVLKLVFYNL